MFIRLLIRMTFYACRRETMAHALQCLARLMRVLLGLTAVANDKLACGVKLDLLGCDIRLSKRGFKTKPRRKKVKKWCAAIDHAITTSRHSPGEASKLAGKLSWGTSKLFRHSLFWSDVL